MDRVHANKGACMNTLPLYCIRLVKGSDYASHHDESLAREEFTRSQLQDVAKSGVRARI